MSDENWWAFSIKRESRLIAEQSRQSRLAGAREVSPESPPGFGRFQLHYHNYLGLDKLLDCQTPTSRTPDERIFIVSHQLFELAFKMMIFDLVVIAKTFQTLLNLEEDEFLRLALSDREEDKRDFWRPALAASARILYSSQKELPLFMGYLADAEMFDSEEFAAFRPNLTLPAGFRRHNCG